MKRKHSAHHYFRKKHPKKERVEIKRLRRQKTVMVAAAAAMALGHQNVAIVSKTISATSSLATLSASTVSNQESTPTIIDPGNIRLEKYQQQSQKEPNERQDIDAIQASLAPTFPASNAEYSTLSASNVIGPVISVCGGIALVAAAMFFIVATKRKRRRREDEKNKESADNNRDDENKFHEISLSDDDDEEENRKIMNSRPELVPLRQSISDFQKPPLPPMPPSCSRSSSITLTDDSRPKSTGSASIASTIYADAFSTPLGSIKSPHASALLKVAERQQLSHERPSVIQTYRAQLAQSIVLSDFNDSQEQALPYQYYTNIR